MQWQHLAERRWAISASEDATLKIWNLQSTKEQFTLQDHFAAINALAVTLDERCVISASDYRTLKVWDLHNKREMFTLQGHSREVMALTATPDGRLVISAFSDGTLRVWDLETGEAIASFSGDGSLGACTVYSDMSTIIAGGALDRIYFLHVEEI